jgi:hypothetical protein
MDLPRDNLADESILARAARDLHLIARSIDDAADRHRLATAELNPTVLVAAAKALARAILVALLATAEAHARARPGQTRSRSDFERRRQAP